MPRSIAITRAISPALADCELTYLERVPIDVERARAQHRAYEEALMEAGYLVERLDTSPQMPDSVFVEDIAIVFDELAIVTRPGAESRRQETPAVAEALAAYRTLHAIQPPATVDGGDILVAGRTVVVGRSSRTNEAAVGQIRQILEPLGYSVYATVVRGCLHLKSAVTSLGDDLLLVNPRLDRPRRVQPVQDRRGRSIRAGSGERAAASRSRDLLLVVSEDRGADCARRVPAAPGRGERAGEGRGCGDVLQPDRRG